MTAHANKPSPMKKRNGLLVGLALLGFLLAEGGSLFAQQDTNAPVLAGGFTFSPTQVDTTAVSAQVAVSAHITDDLSGFNFGYAAFLSPSGTQSVANFSLQSGTALDGMYQGVATIPAFSEPGIWTVNRVVLSDNVGNYRFYYTSDLQALGFPTTLTVVSQQDTNAPVLAGGFTFSPTQVDTTAVSAQVAVSAHITDDLSGFNFGYAAFLSPSGTQSVANFSLQSGTALDGMYQGVATIPAFSEPGIWTVNRVVLSDNVGNYRFYYTSDLQALGFPTTLTVVSQQDTNAPVLAGGFTFSPTQVDTTAVSAQVAVSAHITDDLSGFNFGYAAFLSPSGTQSVANFSLQSGTALDGMYQGVATIPAFSEPGIWTVNRVVLSDNVGNYRFYYTSDLQALGFPTTFEFGSVTATSLVSSANPSAIDQSVTFTATVTSAGGTPTGTVTFYDGASALGMGTLNVSGQATFVTAALTTGQHSITAFYAGDSNFPSSTSAVLTQTVNPGTNIIVGPLPNLSTYEGTSVSLPPATFTYVSSSQTHTATVTWGDGTSQAGTVSESPGSGSVQAKHAYGHSGTYTATVTVADNSGGVGSGTFSVTVINVGPTIAAMPNQTINLGAAITLQPATFSDPGFDNPAGGTQEVFTATIDWGDGQTEPPTGITLTRISGSQFVPTTGTIQSQHLYSSIGTYTATVCVIDVDGALSCQSFRTNVLAVNQSPAITSGNTTTLTAGTRGSFTVTTTGSPSPTLSEVGSLPSGVTFDITTGVLSGIPGAGTGGTYNITFTASNGIGSNAVQNFTLTVNESPTVTSGNSTTFTVGAAGSFMVMATGVPAPTLSESGALPSGVTFNTATGVLSGTPATGTVGTYNISFTATNGVGTDAVQNFTLTINVGPAISSGNITTFTVGAIGTFTIIATGSPTPTFSESGALPSGVTFNTATGVLSGTPATGTAGTYNISFTASNGVESDAVQSFTLTVNEVAAITSGNLTTFTVGTAGSFTVTATGSPTPTLSETGTLPSGVTFKAATGVLSGTPAAGAAGTYNISFTASNGVG